MFFYPSYFFSNEEIEVILRRVNNEVAGKDCPVKQMPEIRHTLRKGLVLTPHPNSGEIMTDLLEKIKGEHQDVAKVLQEADLCTDSDIRSLTGAELHQLFPEQKDLSFEIIHKQKSVGQLLREMKDISGDFKDALTDNGVLVDNLPILKEMQTHMKDMQSFLDGHICSLANIQNQPNQESVTNVTTPRDDYCPEGAHGEVMSDSLQKIKEEHQDVAKVLQEADLCSDSDIRSLTSKLRRGIFEMIQNQIISHKCERRLDVSAPCVAHAVLGPVLEQSSTRRAV
ncbi:uncharacterized protein LOC117492776 isoform X2 [Trematomus bernacchii]|uniref:uncharacterized protein LOC117492776 isoform X2 n=1 Tax=Trematomus bernacchii TaxID=40690 RepID=UPI001469CF5B|nr:uncharacterized protein LOC117492776 isoform X2 [Trematomus bernacchii]